DQDRLYAGRDRVSHPVPPGEGELEHRTVNRITTLLANYSATPDLYLSLSVPYVSRYHEHFDGGDFERFRLDGLGDIALSGRYRFLPDLSASLAVKLPTGNRSSANDEGVEAEPTIAPGTGSTDLSASLVWQRTANVPSLTWGPLGNTGAMPYFVGITGRRNGVGTRSYRVGDELQINAGANYPVSQAFQALLQVNARFKGKDDVGETDAVRDDTGGSFVYLSPGARLALSPKTALYGYVQIPIYQRINGVNIASTYNLFTGLQVRL
ncbi:MAG TPA: hypothetical protein VFS34_12210, partial [Thermoanaerobaculia bacterium]|nr:hypothetical protein [Thermoanaerobaculia bacterium]